MTAPLVDTEQARNFARKARAYCALVDQPPALTREGALLRMSQALADLFQLALRLPDLSDEATPEVNTNCEPAASALQAWVSLLCVDHYWVVFDPFTNPETSLTFNSLADDLSDVYSNLKRGLFLFEAGLVHGACWEWRSSFVSHWGESLLEAERALFLAARR